MIDEPFVTRAPRGGRLGEDEPGLEPARLGDDARHETGLLQPRDGFALRPVDDVGNRDDGRGVVVTLVTSREPHREQPGCDEHEQQEQPGPERRRRPTARRRWSRRNLLLGHGCPWTIVSAWASTAGGGAPRRKRGNLIAPGSSPARVDPNLKP